MKLMCAQNKLALYGPYQGLIKQSATAKTATTKRYRHLSMPIPLFTVFKLKNKLWLFHTATATFNVATPVPTKIAKTFTRPRRFFKTLAILNHIIWNCPNSTLQN